MRRSFLRRNRALLGVAFLAAALAGTWSFWRQSEVQADTTSAIDALVEQAMREGSIAGLSVGILESGRVTFTRGYGLRDVENELPATPETVYSIGSITKQFTAAAIMGLVEDDRVDLDAPAAEYIPDIPGVPRTITVRSLLNHTSGLPNYTMMDDWWETMAIEMTPKQMIMGFADRPLDFHPQTRFAYSNSGYFLLGYIIEQITERPFGGYLNERFFVPLGLDSTRYCDSQALVPNRARGYKLEAGELTHAAYVSTSQAYAAGAVCSNVPDLLRWVRALSEGVAVDSGSYLAMTSPSRLLDGTEIEYGYGLAVSYLDGRRRVSHVGGTLGFSSYLSHYEDEGISIAILTNTEDAKTANLETSIARLLFGLEDTQIRDLILTSAEMEPYTGAYDLGATQITVLPGDGRLEVDVPLPGLEGRYTLLYQGDHTFQAESDSEISVTFTIQDSRADGFILVRKGITMRGERL